MFRMPQQLGAALPMQVPFAGIDADAFQHPPFEVEIVELAQTILQRGHRVAERRLPPRGLWRGKEHGEEFGRVAQLLCGDPHLVALLRPELGQPLPAPLEPLAQRIERVGGERHDRLREKRGVLRPGSPGADGEPLDDLDHRQPRAR